MEGAGKFEGEHAALTEQIIKEFYAVANELGYGFCESVYRNSLAIALRQAGMTVKEEVPIQVNFRGEQVGYFFADLVVDGVVILELKAANEIVKAHELQLLNYLRSSEMEVGLVMAFGERARFRRVVMMNDRKLQPSTPVEVY
jgi:GxxExxY protein